MNVSLLLTEVGVMYCWNLVITKDGRDFLGS